jgi:uncharacterized protein (TIGR02677 family)
MGEIDGMDDGESAGGPGLRVFAYAVYEKAELYIAVLDALVGAKERFRLQLRPAEVARELPGVEEAEVAEALERLAGWGNLSRIYDTAAPETLDEFYSKRFLYQLTPAGVAAHEGVRAVRAAGLDAGGRLSAVLLPGIVERLNAVLVEAREPQPDPARLYTLLVDLFGAFTELADNAGRYMSDLSVETSKIAGDDDSFTAYKRAVLMYLDEFVARLVGFVPRIAAVIGELDDRIEGLVETAAAADLAPSLTGDDAGPRESFLVRWAGVRAWFLREGDQAPIAESLRLAMLDALGRILAAVGRLNERHLRRVSREADFTQLARWFAIADADAAVELWDVGFGLYAARHFGEPAGDEDVERGRSFWDVEPAEVAPRLRAAGRRGSPGRPGRSADYSATKRARLAALRAQHAQAEAAVARLAKRTPARLSDLGLLDHDEFAQLLAVIDAALSTPPVDGRREASTPSVTVRLRPAGDAAVARVRTVTGILSCPDHVIDIVPAANGRRPVQNDPLQNDPLQDDPLQDDPVQEAMS